jgi:transposase InsO family protein
MSHKKNYILVCTYYVTKWVEEKSLFSATKKSVVEFIYEDIFTRFGVPHEIVTDQGTQFTSKMMREITEKYGIKHCKSSPYHPQANGKVESTNKVLEAILTNNFNYITRIGLIGFQRICGHIGPPRETPPNIPLMS